MRRFVRLLPLIVPLALGLGGCAYTHGPSDPVRYAVSPADVAACRRLGPVGFSRTDGYEPPSFFGLPGPIVEWEGTRIRRDFLIAKGEIDGPHFGANLDIIRDSALALGATDVLLKRRFYRDWSYVGGIAYRCRT